MEWNGKEADHQAKTWKMLAHYLAHCQISHSEKIEAVEVKIERDLDAHGLPPLKGVIDLVREGGVIVDFKTAARTPDSKLATHLHEIQLGCYALLYRESTGHQEHGFELHHLIKTKEPKVVMTTLEPMGRDQISRLVQLMESYVFGVEAEDFVPSPGMHCAWCDYLGPCKAWRGHPYHS